MDEEERNYCFLILLLNRVGLPKLRDFFINKWDSAGGFDPWKDCSQNGADLLTKFTPLNNEIPKVKLGDTTTWDLSLFVKALLNSRPPFVPKSKKGVGAGLKCLKKTRDELCHTANGKIENSKFHNLKSSVCNSLMLIGASSKDFKKVKKDVQQPWNELLPLLKHCLSQEKEILQVINTISHRLEQLERGQLQSLKMQEEILHNQSDLQQEMKQSHSGLQQGQQEIMQGQSDLKQEMKQGQDKILKAVENQDKQYIAKSSNLSHEEIASHSRRLKSSTKAQTEFLPKLLASHSVPSTRTDDIFTNLMIQYGWNPSKRFKNFSRQKQLENYNKPSAKHLIDKCQDIFINPDHDKPNPKSILVIGKPGIGKTLFCQRLSRDWADGMLFHNRPDASRVADDFDFVFLMTFRQLNQFCEKQFNFCEVLNRFSVVDEPLFEYIIEYPEKVLFILDGYDEYSHRRSIFDCPFEQKYDNNPRMKMPVAALISKVLRKKIFSSAVVMVTSRPTEADELGEIHMEAVVEIAGFSVEQVKEFIERYFKTKEEEMKNAARDHIMNNENLLSIAHIPALCHLMCFCLEWYIGNGTEKRLPSTITELYSEVVKIFENCCKPIHRASEEKSTVKKLTDLAAAMFMEGRLMFDQRDVERFQLTCPETGNLQSFGLLTCGPAFRESPSKIARDFCFSHLTLHEYFAGLGFVNSGIIPTLEAGGGNEMVLQFCAGLLSGVNGGERLMEKMISPYCCSEHGLLVAKCLHEYGDKEFGVKIIGKYHTQFSDRNGTLFKDWFLLSDSADCVALAYFLDLISEFCKDYADALSEPFCISQLSIELRSSFINVIAEPLRNDSCPLTVLKISFQDIIYSDSNMCHDAAFTDEEILSLSNILPSTHITALHLNGGFTAEGISSLGNVLPSTHITTLHLGGMFTNNDLLTLGEVLPSTFITSLNLISSEITERGIDKLRKMAPACNIAYLDVCFLDEGSFICSTCANCCEHLQ